MGWWKRHTNSCAKWENIVKDAQEAIANSKKKKGFTDSQITRLENGNDNNLKRIIRLAEINYYEDMQKRLDYALGVGRITGQNGREIMEWHIDHETGCLKDFENTAEYERALEVAEYGQQEDF